MATTSMQSCCGLFEFHSFLSLIVLWYALVVGASAVTVTQEPPFASFLQGKELIVSCSHSETSSYHLYWYRQLPGKVELQALGNLYFFDNNLSDADPNLKDRLTGKWMDGSKQAMSLNFKDLQPSDTGLYLCAAREGTRLQGNTDYFAERGTQLLVTDPKCEEETHKPSVVLLGPTCHKKTTTLVCLAYGFFYEWPLDVTWKRDEEIVPRTAVATEKAKAEGTCSFGIASRLSVAAAEWKKGHTYSCHVRQGDTAEVEDEMTNELIQQPNSGLSEMQLSLRTGQFVFLLLAVKSFAYGTVLGIYTACRKTGF